MTDKTKALKTRKGKVTKLIDDKTVKVQVERKSAHPMYKKIIRKHKNYLVERNEFDVKTGMEVAIQECPPISKSKQFKIIKLIE